MQPDLSGFPPKAVFGPALTPGRAAGPLGCLVSPVHRALAFEGEKSRVNAADTANSRGSQTTAYSVEPGVNAGPKTGFAGKGRQRPSTTEPHFARASHA